MEEIDGQKKWEDKDNVEEKLTFFEILLIS
jgi:hypothetical protein